MNKRSWIEKNILGSSRSREHTWKNGRQSREDDQNRENPDGNGRYIKADNLDHMSNTKARNRTMNRWTNPNHEHNYLWKSPANSWVFKGVGWEILEMSMLA